MARRRHPTVKEHPPPQQAPHSLSARRPVTSLLAFALFVELGRSQSELLDPLFSSSDLFLASRRLGLLALPLALIIRRLSWSRIRNEDWSVPFSVIGISMVLSELLVKRGGLWLMQQGFDRGRWFGTLALRGPPILAAATWLAKDPWTSSPTSAPGHLSALLNTLRILLLARIALSPPWLSWISRTACLNLGGLAFVAAAAFLSFSASTISPSSFSASIARGLTSHPSLPTLALLMCPLLIILSHDSTPFPPSWRVDPTSRLLASRQSTTGRIVSTFILQEIVRLARPSSTTATPYSQKALVIGLGAGLAARALNRHGVHTTTVEIDPVVYEYAGRFFGVHEPRGGAYLEDARTFLRRERDKYDYIIHDVFTGGSVPPSLFTMECFSDISRSLTPDGIVAINFAGDIASVASQLIFSTIRASFAHCRAFEDGIHRSSYKNLLFVCSPTRPVVFRKPAELDYLTTISPRMRRKVLDEFETAEVELGDINSELGKLVTDKDVRKLEKAQRGGVKQHWELMKLALPAEVWAMY